MRDAFPLARAQSRSRRARGRVVHHRQRLSLPRHRRRAAGGRAAGAGARRGRRHAIGRRPRRVDECRPTPRHRPREGADPDHDRRGVDHLRPRAGLRAGRRAASRAAGLPEAHRQHEHRRHQIDRTEEIHPDNAEIAEQAARVVGLDIAGIDFICPDISDPGRARPAAGSSRSTPRPASGCTPTPPRARRRRRRSRSSTCSSRPAPTRRIPIVGRHRHERQDDDRADDRPHPQGHGPQGRHDHHRRHLRRRPADPAGRHAAGPRSASMVPAEPDGRLRGVRDRARRDPPRGARLRPQRRGRRRSTSPATTSASAASTPSSSWPTSSGSSSRPCRATAPPSSTPTTRSSPRMGRQTLGIGHLLLDGPGERPGEVSRRRAAAARGDAREGPQRGDDRPAPGTEVDAAGVDPPAAGHLRGPRADERPERAGRGRRRVGRRGPSP